MASGSRTTINLEDGQHPLYRSTIQNEKSHFMKLPKEIRIMIYEFAVYFNGPIKPIQVATRSNKFDWGNTTFDRTKGHAVQRSKGPLAITQLTRVCRKIYRDLEDCPVFYRINQFHFDQHSNLHKFLVAITPSRRRMIRRITMTTEGVETYGRKPHFLTMLLECVDLREFALTWGYHVWQGSERTVIDHLRAYLREADHKSIDEWSVWNLPTFNLHLSFNDLFVDIQKPLIPSSVPSQYSYLNREPIASLVSQLRIALESRKQLLVERGVSMKTMITSNSFQDAVTAANIDFPGEDRVALEIMNSSVGAVSSRTRHRCLPANHDTHTGRIKYGNDEKYDAEGVLKGWFGNIKDVRWKESTIECEVVWYTHNKGFSEVSSSWEKLHAVLTDRGIAMLTTFYHDLTRRHQAFSDASAELERLNSIPSPKNVTDVTHGLLSSWIKEKPRSWKRYTREWEQLQTKFEEFRESLERLAFLQDQKKASSQTQKKAIPRGKKRASSPSQEK